MSRSSRQVASDVALLAPNRSAGTSVGTIVALVFVIALMGLLAWWAFFSIEKPELTSLPKPHRPAVAKPVEGNR